MIYVVLKEIIKLLSEIVGIDEDDLSEKTKLTKDFGIEPIDLASLIIKAEKKFNINIYDEYISSFRNIGDLVLYIEDELDNY